MDHVVRMPRQLGVHLRGLRRARQWSQGDVGAKIGLSQKRLSALERDPAALTLTQLLALGGALGFDVVLRERTNDDLSIASRDASPERW